MLRELAQWRDAVAAEEDRASFRVLPNELLVALAGAAPSTREALEQVRGMPRRVVETRGEELLAAIERGLAVPERELPRLPRGERRTADADFERRVERLKVARNAAAQRLALEPGVLCPKGTLEAVARARPTSVKALLTVPELRRWQIAVLGEEFLRALASG
jgi:ribonuclease D